MTEIDVSEETYERLDRMREDGESFDDLVTELLNIYEAEELTRAHGGDEL